MEMLARAQETLPSQDSEKCVGEGSATTSHEHCHGYFMRLGGAVERRGAPLWPPSQVPEARGGTARRRGEVISAEDVMTVTVPGAGLGIRIVCTSDIFGRNKLSVSP